MCTLNHAPFATAVFTAEVGCADCTARTASAGAPTATAVRDTEGGDTGRARLTAFAGAPTATAVRDTEVGGTPGARLTSFAKAPMTTPVQLAEAAKFRLSLTPPRVLALTPRHCQSQTKNTESVCGGREVFSLLIAWARRRAVLWNAQRSPFRNLRRKENTTIRNLIYLFN